MSKPLLKVEDLSISFEQYGRGLKKFISKPIQSLNIEIYRGEILAIVGASGSGKSLLAHAIMGILPPNAVVNGRIFYNDEILDSKRIKKYRGNKIAFVPQSVNYLDPSMKVKNQVKIGLEGNKQEKKIIQEEIFEKFGLKKSDGERYPYQLSGGMLRRVLFATSIGKNTELIIADEPTPGIHQSVLDIVLKQLRDFADKGMGVMLITHDIGSAIKIADRITVFKEINFEVSPGEILGIFGYSGCGKTSLSKVLSDFLSPVEGEVLIDGKKHQKHKFREVQLIYQHPEKTMNPLWKMKNILEESYTPDDNLLNTFGIRKEWLDRYPIELSGGELQRFSIVRSLNLNTKYLIADEMTTMLDGITQAFIWKSLLKIVRERNLGLIVISHEKDIIEKICDKCLNMESNTLIRLKERKTV